MLTRFMRVPAAGNDLVEMVRPLWCISCWIAQRNDLEAQAPPSLPLFLPPTHSPVSRQCALDLARRCLFVPTDVFGIFFCCCCKMNY